MMIPPAEQPLVVIERLIKTYKMGGETLYALNDISLQIRRGEFLCIIGPSGSGKSTLMNMLGCLDYPSAGSYRLDGEEISKLGDNKLAHIRNSKIGFIFQSFNLLPKLTARQNVELPLVYRGISSGKRKEMALAALDKVGLKDRSGHRPSELSGGQQQRVAIARALAGDPPILLADEPTGALDTKTGAEVMELIKALNKAGHTIILITHDPAVAKQAGRIITLQDGRIAEQGA